MLIDNQLPSAKNWESFKFDVTGSLRKLKALRLINGICWTGNLMTGGWMIQDFFRGTNSTMNLNFFVVLGLGGLFGLGSFKCGKNIKFIRYQLSHFSTKEQKA